MYAELKLKATSTPYNLCQEVVQILTEQITDVSQLVQFDSATSVLITTTPAGWELVATNGFANNTNADAGWVLRAPLSDAPGKYKYIGFTSHGPGTAAGQLIITSVTGSDYDPVNKKILGKMTYQDGDTLPTSSNANTSTYSYNSTGASLFVSINTNDGTATLNMSASVNHIATHTVTTNLSTPGVIKIFSEYERKDAWNTPTSQCVPIVLIGCQTSSGVNSGNGLGAYLVSSPNVQGACVAPIFNDKTATWGTIGQIVGISVPWGPGQYALGASGGYDTASTAMFTDGDGTRHHSLVPMGVHNLSVRFAGGEFSRFCKIYLTTPILGTTYDTLTASGLTYVIWKDSTSTYNFAVLRS